MSRTRMQTQTLAGARFRREGLPSRDAELVRVVERALNSDWSSEAAAWLQDVGCTALPPFAWLRSLGLLPTVAPAFLVPQQLADARAAAVGESTDHGAISSANVIWAKAALHAQFPGDVIEASLRSGESSAVATGGDASTFVQEMLVAAGLAQLREWRESSLDKAVEVLGFLATEYPETPARWMVLATRIATGEAASRSPFLRALLQECTRVALSHDDLVDLIEAAYRHGFGNPVGDLGSVRLAERDPFGLRMAHRTPLMKRASNRAYRVTRLSVALGARSREVPSTEDEMEKSYVQAVLAIAGFEGLLWSGARPSISRLADVCADIVAFLSVLGDETAPTLPAAGVDLIERVLGLARRLDDPVPAVSTVAAVLATWVRDRCRSLPIAVETVLALLPCRSEIGGSVAETLDAVVDSLCRYGDTAEFIDLRDAVRGTDECWRFLRTLGRAR
jgi:hypothetical protein